MRAVLVVLAVWTLSSVMLVLVFAWGSTMGWRRGYAEGYEAARSELASRTVRLDAPAAAVHSGSGPRSRAGQPRRFWQALAPTAWF